MIQPVVLLLALCRFVFSMQQLREKYSADEKSRSLSEILSKSHLFSGVNEYSWAKRLELLSNKLVDSRYFKSVTDPTIQDIHLLSASMTLCDGSQQENCPLINTLTLLDQFLQETFLILVPELGKLSVVFVPGLYCPLAPDILKIFRERVILHGEILGKCVERGCINDELLGIMTQAWQLQHEALNWQEIARPCNLDSYAPRTSLSHFNKAREKFHQSFSFKSLHSLAVTLRHLYFPRRYNAENEVLYGVLRNSLQDTHLALIFHVRSVSKNISGKNPHYSCISVDAILSYFPLAFPLPSGARSADKKTLFSLKDKIEWTFPEKFQSDPTPMARLETAYFCASMSFVLDRIELARNGQMSVRFWIPVVEALAETITLLLPPGTVPKLPQKQSKVILIPLVKNIQGLKDILLAAEKYNLTTEIQTKRLARVVEVFAMAFAILEMEISCGAEDVPEVPAVPFTVYLKIAKAMAGRRKIPTFPGHYNQTKDRVLKLGVEGLANPQDQKCLDLKSNQRDVYEAIFEGVPIPSAQIPVKMKPAQKASQPSTKAEKSSNPAMEASKKQKAADPAPNIVQTPTLNRNQRRKAKKNDAKRRRVAEEQNKPVEQNGPCMALAVVYDSDSDDVDVDPQESSESSSNCDAVMSLQQEKVETVMPEHVAILLDHHDWHLLEAWDARDIAYSYLIIGNYIFTKFLSPLLVALAKKHRNLRDLFNTSIHQFRMEMLQLKLWKPMEFDNAIFQAHIEDVDMLCKCLDWYSKRLQITHQYRALDEGFKLKMAGSYISMLHQTEQGHDLSQGIAGTFNIEVDTEKIFGTPFDRPHGFPCMDTVNYELSVLALHDLLARSWEARAYNELGFLKDLRNTIAHAFPNLAHIRSYISSIYQNHPDHEFLLSILPNCFFITYK